MNLIFSEQQMLQYWKSRLGLAATYGTQPASDLSALDRKLSDDIAVWYESLLATAPEGTVPDADFHSVARIKEICSGGVVIDLPADGRRLLSLRMEGWSRTLRNFAAPRSDADRLQNDPLTRADTDDPVAVLHPRCVEVFGCGDNPVLAELRMTCAPVGGGYELDARLLRDSELLLS